MELVDQSISKAYTVCIISQLKKNDKLPRNVVIRNDRQGYGDKSFVELKAIDKK